MPFIADEISQGRFIPDEEATEKEQAEILSRPAVPAHISEHGERPGETGLQPTSTPWQRFRSSELGHKLFGPTEIEKEGSDLKPGGVGLLEIPQKALQFTTTPPQIADPIRREIDDALARTDQTPVFRGLIKGGSELLLGLPIGALPVLPKTTLAAFGSEYVWNLQDQKKAFNEALNRGDTEEATKIATQAVGAGALIAFGAAHSTLKPGQKPSEIIDAQIVPDVPVERPMLTVPERLALPAPSEQPLLEKGAIQLPAKPTISETIGKVEGQIREQPKTEQPPSVEEVKPAATTQDILGKMGEITQSPMPEKFNTVEDALKFRQQRINEEIELYEREIGLTREEAERLQSILSRDGSTNRFQKKLSPKQQAKMEYFFEESPYNKIGGPFEFWEFDPRLDPESLVGETDKTVLSSALVSAVQRGLEAKPTSDQFLSAIIAARQLKDIGATKTDIAHYLDSYTTRESSSHPDKAELFGTLARKVNGFLNSQGISMPEGDLGKKPSSQQSTQALGDVREAQSGIGIIPGVDPVAKAVGEAFNKGLDFYSQPLTDRLAAEGGTAAKGFANMAREMTQRTKALFGSLSPTLDPALQATGRLNKATTWLNDIAPTTQKWGYRNAVQAVEGPIASVPAEYRPTVDALKAANLDIGRLAFTVTPGAASGKYQRMPTDFLVDTIRSGQGDTYDLLVRALSRENRIPESRVRSVLEGIKAEFDAPGSQQTIHRISQEFERKFPKFPTDLKIKTPIAGEIWMPILHAQPFDYLSKASLSTAQRVAFLERIPTGNIGQIREQVVRELKTPDAFDDLVRALHGLPLNKPFNTFPPGSPQAMAISGVNRALSDIFASAKLTVSAIYNIGETFLGNTPAFFGWRNFVKGAASLPARHANLEAIGAITRNFYNWSFDPKSPVRSILRDYRLLLRKGTAQQFFNELQEKLAGSTAQVFAEQAQGGSLSRHQQNLFTETAVSMGFQRPAAKAMAEGRGTPEQYGDFVRRSSAFTTGGNQLPPEGSRMGGNRILNSLFRFQSYPMMKMNSFRQAYTRFFEAAGSGDAGRIKASSEQLAKFLFGTTAQGAAGLFLAALLTGRGGGVDELVEDAKESPGGFILDSFVGGMGGPVSAIYYVASGNRPSKLLDIRNLNPGITFPGSIYMELMELFRREGPYAGMTMPGAIKKYLSSKVPVGKAIRHALEATGAIKEQPKAAQSDVYRWIQKWAEDSKDTKVKAWWSDKNDKEYPASKYASLRDALGNEDYERAKTELESLKEKSKLEDIIQEMASFREPFTGNHEREKAFKASLDADQLKRYEAAQAERRKLWERFQKLRKTK